jgi:hypothetical protein
MVHRVTCALLSVSGVLLCRDTAKDAELLALRREKAMARRQLGGPVRYEPTDQFWLAARSSPIPRCDWSRVFPVPGDIAGLARRPIAKRWDYSVWFTTEPGAISWYRVVEVNLPLYQDEQGMEQLDLAGMRLACLEAGVASERIVPTRQTYQVGHYVLCTPARRQPERSGCVTESAAPCGKSGTPVCSSTASRSPPRTPSS